MMIISWNVAGLRSILKKGLSDFILENDADIYCLQETKVKNDYHLEFNNYYTYLYSAERYGYSGVLVSSKIKPIKVIYGLGNKAIDEEGRVITFEYENFYLVNLYAPHSQPTLERLDYHILFADKLRQYVTKLKINKSVIIVGDFNVAYEDIDIHPDKKKRQKAGITEIERKKFGELLDTGFIDTYRYLYNDNIVYTNWCYAKQARERNVGWRVDYFLVSSDIATKLVDTKVLTGVLGSDHCPIELDIKISI